MGCQWLDPRYLDELTALEPAEVCARTAATWDPERRVYSVAALGGPVEVDAARRSVARPGPAGAEPVSLWLALTVLFYLLRGQDLPLEGRWISEKELPGGTMFFQKTHALPLDLVAERFGADREGFLATGGALGGAAVEEGDAAVEFPVLPRVPVRVVLWLADAEFPADARMLFDASLEQHLPLDVIYGLAVELCRLLAGVEGGENG